MKMKNALILGSILMILTVISCKKEDTTPDVGSNIRFDNLKVGQKSRYVKWQSKKWWEEADTTFKQIPDTVTLTIVSQDTAGFKVSESHNAGTSSTYYFKTEGDTLRVKPFMPNGEFGSFLFYTANMSFVLKDNNLEKTALTRWAVPKNMNVVKGFYKVENLKINATTYDNAIAYFNSNPIIVDGPAIFNIYNKEKGFISFQSLGGFAPLGIQYNLLQ
jgi:hypothetical protein